MTKETKIFLGVVLITVAILLIGWLNNKGMSECIEAVKQKCWEADELNCLVKAKEECEFRYGGM